MICENFLQRDSAAATLGRLSVTVTESIIPHKCNNIVENTVTRKYGNVTQGFQQLSKQMENGPYLLYKGEDCVKFSHLTSYHIPYVIMFI